MCVWLCVLSKNRNSSIEQVSKQTKKKKGTIFFCRRKKNKQTQCTARHWYLQYRMKLSILSPHPILHYSRILSPPFSPIMSFLQKFIIPNEIRNCPSTVFIRCLLSYIFIEERKKTKTCPTRFCFSQSKKNKRKKNTILALFFLPFFIHPAIRSKHSIHAYLPIDRLSPLEFRLLDIFQSSIIHAWTAIFKRISSSTRTLLRKWLNEVFRMDGTVSKSTGRDFWRCSATDIYNEATTVLCRREYNERWRDFPWQREGKMEICRYTAERQKRENVVLMFSPTSQEAAGSYRGAWSTKYAFLRVIGDDRLMHSMLLRKKKEPRDELGNVTFSYVVVIFILPFLFFKKWGSGAKAESSSI